MSSIGQRQPNSIPFYQYQNQQSRGYGGNNNGGSNRFGTPRDGTPHSDTPLSLTNLYLRGLKPDATDDYLRQLCSKYGKISSTKAIMDKNTNQCKGYGFVDFENPDAAQMAVEKLNEEGYQAQMAKQQEQDPTNLYIANLPLDFNESMLEGELTRYGNVVSTRILRNSEDQSRGVGFARMDSKEKCEDIINALNGGRFDCMDAHQPTLLIKQADTGKKTGRKRFDQFDSFAYGGQEMIRGFPHVATGAQFTGPSYYQQVYYDQMVNQMSSMQLGGGGAGSQQQQHQPTNQDFYQYAANTNQYFANGGGGGGGAGQQNSRRNFQPYGSFDPSANPPNNNMVFQPHHHPQQPHQHHQQQQQQQHGDDHHFKISSDSEPLNSRGGYKKPPPPQ